MNILKFRTILSIKHSFKFTSNNFAPTCGKNFSTEDKAPKKPQTDEELFKSSINYCIDQVRKMDYDHYVIGHFFPKGNKRNAYYAIRALNIELAIAREHSNSPERGNLRLQWWRETIHEVFAGKSVPVQPVLRVLIPAIKEFKLSRIWFDRLLNRREKDLLSFQPRTLEDLEQHVEQIHSSLYYLNLEILGIRNTNAEHAISHVGKAMGLITTLRGVHFNVQRKRLYLPMNSMAKAGLSSEDFFNGKFPEKTADICFEIADQAKAHLDKARLLQKELPKEVFPAFLPAVVVAYILKLLQKINFNVFNPKLTFQNPLGIMFRLWKSNWAHKF